MISCKWLVATAAALLAGTACDATDGERSIEKADAGGATSKDAGGRDASSDTGTGGAGGAAGTTNTGGVGIPGTGGGTSGSGTDGGSGDGSALGKLGDPCPENGATACDGHAQQQPIICVNHVWGPNGKCTSPANYNCDSTPGANVGTCEPIVAECIGKKPGDAVCQGMNRVACGPDLVTTSFLDTCVTGTQTCERDLRHVRRGDGELRRWRNGLRDRPELDSYLWDDLPE
jgi:hypothetical protein